MMASGPAKPGPDVDGSGGKADGAMLSIGELANRLGVPTHILRYWETRFPGLKPLQRSGRRRYYRADDVALAERIHDLLHSQGFTVDGARRVLDGQELGHMARRAPLAAQERSEQAVDVTALRALRDRLAHALLAAT